VVNEPIQDPPDEPGLGGGNYIEALGGSGSTGWDWVIEAFRLARKYFPDTKLMINEYGVISGTSDALDYIEIIELLQAEDTLIDAIGIQGHGFSNNASSSTISNCLELFAGTGLPIYITEFDIDGTTDEFQLSEYQRVFPLFWEHPAVKGITFWGYRPGMWRTDADAYIVNTDGTERPAMVWLKAYIQGTFVRIDSIIISPAGGLAEINTDNGTLQLNAEIQPENATLKIIDWRISIKYKDVASIDDSGLLTAIGNGTVTVTAFAGDGSGLIGYLDVSINNQISGIEDKGSGNTENVIIYPDPAVNGGFTMQGIESITQVKILDLTGKQVKKLNVLNQSSVYIKLDTEPGIYIIEIYNGVNFFYRKIIVE